MTVRTAWLALIACLLTLVGCSSGPQSSGDPGTAALRSSHVLGAEAGAATVTTDSGSYALSSPITVTWGGLPGNPKDWIALAPAGSGLGTVDDWVYTGGSVSGSHVFSGLSTAGSYVARAFDNDTYTLLAESAPFTVSSTSTATVSTDKSSYGPSDNVTVSWTGMPGNPTDWVAIAPQGSSLGTLTAWAYTGGTVSGSVVFAGPSTSGTYVARAFTNNSYTLAAESAPFTVGASSATLVTDLGSYSSGQDITVTWTGLPGNPKDWIALAPQGSSLSTTPVWFYTGGAVSGSHTFVGGISGTGTYVARAFANDTYSLLVESSPFTVGPSVTVTTDQATYVAGKDVTITWTGLPGNPKDWIAIAPQGSPFTTLTAWDYTGGAVNGSIVLPGPTAAGTYVARAFINDTNVLAGESAPFTVTASPATIATDLSAYTVGQDIVVTWSNLPGNSTDWVALAPQGSSDVTTTAWVYTGGATAGSHTFVGGIATAGTYVARAFADDTYNLLVEGSPFTVM